jgi:Family of unknown function (DUF5681)
MEWLGDEVDKRPVSLENCGLIATLVALVARRHLIAGLAGSRGQILMPENAGRNQGRWEKGQSGNPHGKPRGVRHHATRVVEQLLDKDARLLAQKARDMALAGDTVALKLCLERLCPPRRNRPVNLDLPAIETLGDASAAISTLIASAAAGEVTPDEATSIVGLIDAKRRVLVDVDLEARVTALEAGAQRGDGGR